MSVLQSTCSDAPPASNSTPAGNVPDAALPTAANLVETPVVDVAEDSDESIHHYIHKKEQPHTTEWAYTDKTGPGPWGNLSPEYVLAKTGRQQSPIDIESVEPASMSAIEFTYGLR